MSVERRLKTLETKVTILLVMVVVLAAATLWNFMHVDSDIEVLANAVLSLKAKLP